MKKEKYIVEIEMPDGDGASPVYIQDVIQSDCDVEDKDRWKVSVKEYWKPSEDQINALAWALSIAKNCGEDCSFDLRTLYEQLKKLREE